jgi:hypothetical protein
MQTQYRGGRWIAVLLIGISILGFACEALRLRSIQVVWPPQPDASWLLNAASTAIRSTLLALAALWLAWGTYRLRVRLVAFFAVPILCAGQLELNLQLWKVDGIHFPDLSEFLFDYLIQLWCEGLVLAAMATLMRVAGFRLARFSADELAGRSLPISTTSYRPVHFTLSSIFKWTAIVALLLMLLPLIRAYTRHDVMSAHVFERLFKYPDFWVTTAIRAVPPLALAWGVLTARPLALRVLTACLLSFAPELDWYIPKLDSLYFLQQAIAPSPRWQSFVWTGMYAAVLAATFFVFRYAGYRLLWRKMRDADTMQVSAVGGETSGS